MSNFPLLQYRGNFQVVCEEDYSQVSLSAQYPGRYREDVTIGAPSGFHDHRLTYSALHKHAYITLDNGQRISRTDYIRSFVRERKGGGNTPFLLRCPYDQKLYLSIFNEDVFSYTLIDYFLSTTGLVAAQVSVKGVTVNADGSYC